MVRRPDISGLGVLRRAVTAILLAGFFAIVGFPCAPALAQEAPPQPVQEFVKLLDDPAVRAWLDQAKSGQGTAPAPTGRMDSAELASRLSGVRQHLTAVAGALPRFPSELRRASGLLLQEMNERGLAAVLVLIVGFVVLGY